MFLIPKGIWSVRFYLARCFGLTSQELFLDPHVACWLVPLLSFGNGIGDWVI